MFIDTDFLCGTGLARCLGVFDNIFIRPVLPEVFAVGLEITLYFCISAPRIKSSVLVIR